jgi:hypothetical protein
MRRRDSLRRRRAFRDPLPRMLIVCEGTRTEPGYFNDLRHAERGLVDLKISPGGVPRTLVERAVELKDAAEKDAKSRRDENLSYDEVWCVFDIDEHPGVPDAKQQARDNGIELAISNPCFELWMLLHFRDQRAYIDRSAVQGECAKYLPGYEKRVPFAKLHPKYGEALERAVALDAWQQTRGCEGLNPWTGIHRLTEKIRSFGQRGV